MKINAYIMFKRKINVVVRRNVNMFRNLEMELPSEEHIIEVFSMGYYKDTVTKDTLCDKADLVRNRIKEKYGAEELDVRDMCVLLYYKLAIKRDSGKAILNDFLDNLIG